MRKLLFIFTLISFVSSAQTSPPSNLKAGTWRAVLLLDRERNIELPFNFDLVFKNKTQLVIKNAGEKIVVDEITMTKDSFNFKMPVFDSEFRTKITSEGAIEGIWINHARKDKNIIPFKAQYNNPKRFDFPADKPHTFYTGNWETTFSPGTADSSKALGVFKHEGGSVYVTGTFLTETGDYRYLEGMMSRGKLYLSCFDGAHAFLFTAENDGVNIVRGNFYSGVHWQEPWIAKRNDNYKLKDPESITTLKTPDEKVSFSFPNLDKKTVSLNDEKFKNKVVVIQIMGSWCPNCMDETAYLSKVYKQYKIKGLEVVALAYEKSEDFEKNKKNITRLKNKYGVEYEMLITGLSGKAKASESMAFLNGITAFPTTIILDRKHNVKSIYTGFSGPATGKEFENYKAKTESLLTQLLLKKD